MTSYSKKAKSHTRYFKLFKQGTFQISKPDFFNFVFVFTFIILIWEPESI